MVQEGELKHALVYLIVRLYSLSKTQAKPRKTNPTELAGEYHSLRNHSEKFLIGIFLSYLIFEIMGKCLPFITCSQNVCKYCQIFLVCLSILESITY